MQTPQLQQSASTSVARYWSVYSVLRRYFSSDRNLKILSFGCSTGEELVTLKTLFPSADLFGCDTDWYNLQRARAMLKSSALVFQSSDQEVEAHGPYDIIVCNSVLLRHGKQGIETSLWLDVVEVLDRSLRPGGVIQIINSNIPFRLHPKAANYEPLRSPVVLSPSFVDMFDLEGTHLCSRVARAGFTAMLSCHLGEDGWKLLRPSDLDDVHFGKKGGKAWPEITDELIPNFRPAAVLASGQTTYRTQVPEDPRPTTKVDLDISWKAFRGGGVRLRRTATRVWFDSTETKRVAEIDLIKSAATAFIEMVSGRGSTRLTFDELMEAQPVYSALV